jgi:hypothetical protein
VIEDRRLAELIIAVIRPNSPTIDATVQAAHIHPSTAGRRLVELTKQIADAVYERANGGAEGHVRIVSQENRRRN